MEPILKKNDKKANIFIVAVSLIVFIAVVILSRVKLEVTLPFDVHVFATINAILNSGVAVFLLFGLLQAKKKNYVNHRKMMLTAIVLSVFFLLSYIAHHLLAGDTRFGDVDHDGLLSPAELNAAGSMRTIYFILLFTHIPLAGIILPFILYTAYRALTGEYAKHKKLARITWPIWWYVAISGVIVYLMINPYYN